MWSRRLGRTSVAALAIAGLAAAGSANLTSTGGSRTYTVQAGDTATSIAARFLVTVDALRVANGMTDPNYIFVGEHLVIPSNTRRSSSPSHVSAGPLAAVATPPNTAPVFPSRLRAHPSRLTLLPMFRHWSRVSGVPAGLLEAMAWMESGWQTRVVSSTGAIGVGQIEPPTVVFICNSLLGLAHPLDPRNPDANIRMSAAYLAWLLRRTNGNVANALGGYYQGLASLASRGPWDQTRTYVATIGALWRQFGSG